MSMNKHALAIEKLADQYLDYRKIVYTLAQISPSAFLDALDIIAGKPRSYNLHTDNDVIESPDKPVVKKQPSSPLAPVVAKSPPVGAIHRLSIQQLRERVIALLKASKTEEAIEETRRQKHSSRSEAALFVNKIRTEEFTEAARMSYDERAEAARSTADEIMARRKDNGPNEPKPAETQG